METVSEKTAMLPFGETAMTLPVARPRGVPAAGRGVNGLVEDDAMLDSVTSAAPSWLPMYALSPALSNIKELGGVGSRMGLAAIFVFVEMLYIATVHCELLKQSWLVARTVAVEVAPVSNPEIAVTG